MPTDAYLNTFETRPIAGCAHFWARSWNWLFEDWRNADLAAMSPDEGRRFANAISSEAYLADHDLVRCMAKYRERFDPTQPARACGCCGRADVPLPPESRLDPALVGLMGVLSFTEVRLDSRFMQPLQYTPEQTAAYELPVPRHINDTAAARENWARYRLAISQIPVRLPDGTVTRLHLYPQLCGAVGHVPSPFVPRVPPRPGARVAAAAAAAAAGGGGGAHTDDAATGARGGGGGGGGAAAGGADARPVLLEREPVAADAYTTHVCGDCYTSLRARRAPRICVASGWDLGTPEHAGLNCLSLAGELAVARARCLSTALNLRLPRRAGYYFAVKGHSIVYDDDAADACAARMPDIEHAADRFTLSLEGPEAAVNSPHVERLLAGLGCIHANAADVRDWLLFLQYVNPRYADIEVREYGEVAEGMRTFTDRVIRGRVRLPYHDGATEVEAARARANITRPNVAVPEGPAVNEPADIVGELQADAQLLPNATYVVGRYEQEDENARRRRVLRAISRALRPPGRGNGSGDADADGSDVNMTDGASIADADGSDVNMTDGASIDGAAAATTATTAAPAAAAAAAAADDVNMTAPPPAGDGAPPVIVAAGAGAAARAAEGAGAAAAAAATGAAGAGGTGVPTVIARRGAALMNTYVDTDRWLAHGHPTIFCLGQGTGSGPPLTEEERRWCLMHFTRRAATNQRFVAALHSMKTRADNGRVCAAAVRTDTVPLQNFHRAVTNPNMEQRLAAAEADIEGPEARAILREMEPLLMITSSHVPFSPTERRTRAAIELYGMVRYKGLPNAFITVGPDETVRHAAHARARSCCLHVLARAAAPRREPRSLHGSRSRTTRRCSPAPSAAPRNSGKCQALARAPRPTTFST